MITDRQNAIGLVDRLLALDTRIHELERENSALKARLHVPAALPSASAPPPPRSQADAVIMETLARTTEFLNQNPCSQPASPPAAANAAPLHAIIIILPTGAHAATLATWHSLASHKSRFTMDIRINDGPSPLTTRTIAPARFIVLIEAGQCVAPCWLDELLGCFAQWPQAGLVGAKSYAPDGALHHAGYLIRPDGAAAPRGQGGDPNHPQYCHAREVDFIIGALALPLSLWRRLGGHAMLRDPPCSMARSLAHRARAAGRQIWYQPLARIVQYQTPSPQPARTRHILVVDLSAPTPDEDAGSQQTFLVLKSCLQAGLITHFVPQGDWRFRPHETAALQRQGVICAYAPYDDDFDAFMAREAAQFDAILVFRAPVMAACLPVIRARAPRAAIMFHVADLHHLRLQRQADLAADDNLRAAAVSMRRRELRLIAAADVTITHSIAEQKLLAEALPSATVKLWPLMAEPVGTSTPFAARRDLCFLGNYTHAPNLDGAVHFITEIFPLVLARLPDIRLILAGPHPGDALHRHAGRNIIVTDKIADLRDLFDPVRIFICPLRAGAGVKGKIISALAHGLPVVSTSIGVEGAGLTDGHDILVADDPPAFAEAICQLYQSESIWQQLSTNGQIFIRNTAAPDHGQHILTAILNDLFAERSKPRL